MSASPLCVPLDLPRPAALAPPAVFGGMPAGQQTYWGVAFQIAQPPLVVVVGAEPVDIALDGTASHIVFAHACTPAPPDAIHGALVGQPLADYSLITRDGATLNQPIRRRFEIDAPHLDGFDLPFAARPSRAVRRLQLEDVPRLAGPYAQTGVAQDVFQDREQPLWWIYALVNPWPEALLRALRISSRQPSAAVVVGGVTLFRGEHHPLRHRSARLVRVPLREPSVAERVAVDVDLGIVGRRPRLLRDDPADWLSQPYAAWGEEPGAAPAEGAEVRGFISTACEDPPRGPESDLAIEVAATDDAVLTVHGERHRVLDLEVLDPDPVWIEGHVVDAASRRPTPARLHLHTPAGVYAPPYGHHVDVGTAWADDRAAELKLNATSFAYVDGTFRVRLPPGPVYAEVHKGFEYEPTRVQLVARPGQPLEIPIQRRFDSGPGWMSSDTHVHFLSPHTALLEAEAEDVDLINLLAAQWGDLFSNVGDLGWGEAVRRGPRSVWMGTENRQHILGHLGLLGTGLQPVEPFSAAGVIESGIGDPAWLSMAEWATLCHERGGLAVAAHFALPYGEASADIVLGKLDAVELRTFGPSAEVAELITWYRHLNVGHRIPCVGGTDKMWSVMPVGDIRTYAQIGPGPVDFHSFGGAVRAGRTFATTGPFVELMVDGRHPGDTIELGSDGGTLEALVSIRSAVPFSGIELVCNGEVVAEARGVPELRARVPIRRGSWLAARVLGPAVRRCNGWPSGIGAHTSPIYITVGGRGAYQPQAVAELDAVIEGVQLWVETLATVASAEAHARLRGVFVEARARLAAASHSDGHLAS